MTTISPEALVALRARLSFRLLVGTVMGLLVAGVAALVGLGVDAVGPTVPFWVPLLAGAIVAVLYTVSTRPRPGEQPAAASVAGASGDASGVSPAVAQAEAADAAKAAAAAGLVALPGDVVRLLSGRQVRVAGTEAVRMVIAPGQRLGLIAAAHLSENPDAVSALGSVVAATRDEAGLPLHAILVDLDGTTSPERHELVTVTGRAGVAAAAMKLQKFSVSELMAIASRAR